MVIKAIDPGQVGGGSGSLGGAVVGVSPLECEGAVEAFDLPVRLGSVGARVLVRYVAQGGVEQLRAVTGSVVGKDSLLRDAVRAHAQS